MTLNEVIKNLIALAEQGHGEKQVFSIHGASGDVNEVSTAHITNHVGDCGPFDLEPGEEYVSIYIGN
jgi:hypothetical protein